MAGRRLWQAPWQQELTPKQGPSSGMSEAISLQKPPVSNVPRRAWPGPKTWGAPQCAGPHWARERESMAPLFHGTSGAGQPRALGCSHPRAESVVQWCGVKCVIHHEAESGPGCFPKKEHDRYQGCHILAAPMLLGTSTMLLGTTLSTTGTSPLRCPLHPDAPSRRWFPNLGVVQTQQNMMGLLRTC